MPTPDEVTEYIEIADFSPGIHSDTHIAATPLPSRVTAGEIKGTLFGNGIARVDGTNRCHADKTGALVPLPKAQATGMRDNITSPVNNRTERPFRYVLDAQIGNTLVDATETEAAPFAETRRTLLQIMWGFDVVGATGWNAAVIGREYRLWLSFPGSYSNTDLPLVDFLISWAVGDSNTMTPLPIGSLCRGRFYYGSMAVSKAPQAFTVVAATDVFTATAHSYADNEAVILSSLTGAAGVTAGPTYYIRDSTVNTFKLAATIGGAAINITSDGSGNVARLYDPPFQPLWAFPVSVALAATPWVRWGAGNRLHTETPIGAGRLSYLGVAPDIYATSWSYDPAIGLKGEGTAIIAMQLNKNVILNMPFPSIIDRWFHHYSERGNVPQNNIIEDIANGPINPYMVIAHQGRIVILDARRTMGILASTSNAIDHGFLDDLLFYSNYGLPTQDFVTPALTTDRGVANAAYGEYPQVTMLPYNKLLVAEDVISGVGTVGVVTIDQLLLVKHFGGGALVSGDLDNPTIHRLPYIEPTRGVVCKGAHTPIGFVYGSDNGIFIWQGGDDTKKLSPQLDGFFWNHTDGSFAETYAGSRGRMAYWNGLICVPNNYVYDIERESWWRFQVKDLLPASSAIAPYNCYDVDERNVLYAFPYRHTAPIYESHALFPASATNLNVLTIPDAANFSAPANLDIRFALDNVAEQSGIRTIASHYGAAGNRAWWVRLTTDDKLEFITSTDGTAIVTATCDAALMTMQLSPILGRVTWRASDGRVQFFRKAVGDMTTQLRNHNGWDQIGADKVASAAALFDSTDVLAIGNQGAAGLSSPYIGRAFAFSLATAIAGTPVIEIIPANFPVNTAAASFPCATGQTVTVTRAGAGPALTLVYVDQTVAPVWYTFNWNELESAYTWQSHPLLESRGRIISFQTIELLATGRSTAGTAPTVAVTLSGFNEDGSTVTPVTTTFTLALKDEAQLLRKDFVNFQAEYVTVKLTVTDPNGNPAPKIHSVRLGAKQRARTPRHG